MEMCLHPTTVVLLTVAVMVSPAPGEVIVHVMPRQIHLSIGSCATLSCCAEHINNFWLEWWFNPSVPSLDGAINLTEKNFGKFTKTQQPPQQQQCPRSNKQNCTMTLGEYTILNASKSGWYFCKVTIDIPVLEHIISTGAEIVVTKNLMDHATYPPLTTIGEQENPADPSLLFSWWIWTILGVSCLIVVVLLITCIIKRRGTTRDVECPIYSNTRNVVNRQPSPRPRNPTENMKAESPYQNDHTPNFGRRFDNDRLRYNHLVSERTTLYH